MAEGKKADIAEVAGETHPEIKVIELVCQNTPDHTHGSSVM